jgi:osmoprotectant transport system permease protein
MTRRFLPLRHRIAVVFAGVLVTATILLVSHRSMTAGGMRAAFDTEFLTRPDGYLGLKKHYGFAFPAEPIHLDPGLMYKAVADGAVDVICGFATDGRIQAYDLVILKDDKSFFPPYHAAPLVRAETLKRHPELRPILEKLAGRLSDERMRRLNFEVDENGRKADDVAREWLVSEGLVPSAPPPTGPPQGVITIGGKEFTEQDILGHLMAILIETDSDLKVDLRLSLGGTMICLNALKAGDLDIYPEYTGTALVGVMKQEVINDPNAAYRAVKNYFEKEYGIIWLEPFGFNNTYTLTMRKEQAERMGITTISDLAEHINAAQGSKSAGAVIGKRVI